MFYLPTLTVEQLHEIPLGFVGGSHPSCVDGELSIMARSLHQRSYPDHRAHGLSVSAIVFSIDCALHLVLVDRKAS